MHSFSSSNQESDALAVQLQDSACPSGKDKMESDWKNHYLPVTRACLEHFRMDERALRLLGNTAVFQACVDGASERLALISGSDDPE